MSVIVHIKSTDSDSAKLTKINIATKACGRELYNACIQSDNCDEEAKKYIRLETCNGFIYSELVKYLYSLPLDQDHVIETNPKWIKKITRWAQKSLDQETSSMENL